jgi:hypothetical protein
VEELGVDCFIISIQRGVCLVLGEEFFFVAFLRFFFSSLYFYTFCLFLIRRGLDWIGWSGRFFFQSVIQCMMFFCAYDTLLTVPCRTVRVEVIPSFLPFFPFPFLCFHVAHRGITGDAVQCMILA